MESMVPSMRLNLKPNKWGIILDQGVTLVGDYPYLITLRQLHYLLVMTPNIDYHNDQSHYKRLSSLTAEARRQGVFPTLLDQTREIHQVNHWASPQDAMAALIEGYRLDRTRDQDHLVVLGGEKATLLAQLESWFDDLGMPVVLLRGYGSQTYVDDIRHMILRDGRKPVLIYAGDFDPSGEDILRDFLARCGVFDSDNVVRIAIEDHQIAGLGLVVNSGKPEDPRTPGFVERYRDLHAAHDLGFERMAAVRIGGSMVSQPTPIQVEVEAIAPDVLRGLYQAAIDRFWDTSLYEAVVAQEEIDRDTLGGLSEGL
jgi:hypothetical protein